MSVQRWWHNSADRQTRVLPCIHGKPAQMTQLDSNHWFVEVPDCNCEGVMHWSKVAARAMWNRPMRAYKEGK